MVDYKFAGGVAELAYAGDLKSSAFGIVGSSPTAPTSTISAPATGPFAPEGSLPLPNAKRHVDLFGQIILVHGPGTVDEDEPH